MSGYTHATLRRTYRVTGRVLAGRVLAARLIRDAHLLEAFLTLTAKKNSVGKKQAK